MKKNIYLSLALSLFLSILFCDQNIFAQKEKEVYSKVDIYPEYPGGNDALIKFIVHELKYPEDAKKEGIEGKVFVEFIVEKSGKVTDAKVLKGIGYGCDEEAVRLVNMLKPFKPGMKNGKAVDVQLTLPFSFKLEEK